MRSCLNKRGMMRRNRQRLPHLRRLWKRQFPIGNKQSMRLLKRSAPGLMRLSAVRRRRLIRVWLLSKWLLMPPLRQQRVIANQGSTRRWSARRCGRVSEPVYNLLVH
ncbi:MAG: TilS substrate-binding domain-containing protein [Candidatus Moraniibacteriota bacterium]|nr:MAG: TilS substrate-binding domain-containing protein [Candidatus Moranbacteria bacterium]